jgi:hypothetical protein
MSEIIYLRSVGSLTDYLEFKLLFYNFAGVFDFFGAGILVLVFSRSLSRAKFFGKQLALVIRKETSFLFMIKC